MERDETIALFTRQDQALQGQLRQEIMEKEEREKEQEQEQEQQEEALAQAMRSSEQRQRTPRLSMEELERRYHEIKGH